MAEPRRSEIDPPASTEYEPPGPEITGGTEDPPAATDYEPPGPEITGEDTGDIEQNDIFQDEPDPPKSSTDPQKGDPGKWNFSPTTIVILVILNLIAAGLLGYLIWYAVDKSNETSVPTGIPTPSPTPPPTISARPSAAPSVSTPTTAAPSGAQPTSQVPTSNPTTPPPTPIASDSPTEGPFTCDLCGEGKEMTILTGNVAFGSRVTRTCQELLDDQNNGYILEDQCLSLYDDIVDVCGCRPTASLTRTDVAISDVLFDKVGTAFNTTSTDENSARAFLLNSAQDTYFNTARSYATDDEIIQRYLVLLALYQMNLSSLIDGSSWECTWSFVTCEYGQVTSFKLDGTVNAATSPTFPVDLFNLTTMEEIGLNSYTFSNSTLPTDIGLASRLTSLNLSTNALTGTLPDEIFELRSLTTLDLSSNTLSGSLDEKSKIKQLIRLTTLDLGSNTFNGTLLFCDISPSATSIVTDCDGNTPVTCSCCTSCANGATV